MALNIEEFRFTRKDAKAWTHPSDDCPFCNKKGLIKIVIEKKKEVSKPTEVHVCFDCAQYLFNKYNRGE